MPDADKDVPVTVAKQVIKELLPSLMANGYIPDEFPGRDAALNRVAAKINAMSMSEYSELRKEMGLG